MKQIIFESPPIFVVVALFAGLGYAALLYTSKYPWSKQLNWILFSLRAILACFLAFLLLGPIVKHVNNVFEKPLFVILQDDSKSIKESVDSTVLHTVQQQLNEIQDMLSKSGYDVKTNNLEGDEIGAVQYKASASDLDAALKKISNRYEGRNIGGVILLSDGIYNGGISPLYTSYNFPVNTIGLGDSSQRMDLSIKNIAYNKIVYQGNRFPVRVEVLVSGLPDQFVNVSLSQHGTLLEKQSKNAGLNQLLVYDFEILAKEQGIQKLDVQVEIKPQEHNIKNNRASAFVEVVEGKKKILVVSAFPHPDIKALREVIDKNSNYEFLLHIPGLSEQPPALLRPEQIDLAVFYQSPDVRGKTRDLFQLFSNSKTSILVTLGQQSDVQMFSRTAAMPIHFIGTPRDYDEVTPVINSGFSNFEVTAENNAVMTDYPPVSVHFGKIQFQPNTTSILFQRVGSIATEKPLLTITTDETHKMGVLLGEGIWRWRLNEFDRTSNTTAFDELFGKLIQYLSTTDDKRKFRSYPLQQEFSDTEPVTFESQVYNDIFEPIYGNTIELDLTDEHGKKTPYTYVTSPGNIRYSVGGLKEGVYKFRSKTTLNGKLEEVKGEFAVVERQAELQNLTADFDLLRRLSANTGGKFYTPASMSDLKSTLQKVQAKSIIHSEEQFDSLINLKWIFGVLVLLASTEWFLRKYHGSY